MKYDELLVAQRDGNIVSFELKRISSAITKAFEGTKTDYTDDIISLLTLRVTADFQNKIEDGIISVENIQDSVEKVLQDSGYGKVAKAYILYRKTHEKLRDTKGTLIDYAKVINDYVKVDDWRVKENSTVTYSIGGLILSNSGAVTANYWLSEVYDEEIGKAHKDGDLHLHDLSMLAPYCAGWSLKQLITEGLGGIEGKISSAPPSHLSTLCNQMVNFLGILQNEWAGAQAFSSFDTYLAPFVKVDNLSYKEVKQCLQSFIFGVNTPSRWGCVDTDTEVLSVNGFKKYNELKEGELIYTYNNGRLELNPVRKVITKPFKGKLHSYLNRGYNQTVTPNHRVLVFKHNSKDSVIKLSEDIFNVKTPFALPVVFSSSEIKANNNLNDDYITLAAMYYTDGSIDLRNNTPHKIVIFKSPNRFGNKELKKVCKNLNLNPTVSKGEGAFGDINKYCFYGNDAKFIYNLCGKKDDIDKKFLSMNKSQAELFLKIWASCDGDETKMLCQFDNEIVASKLQQIAILSGHCSYITKKKLKSGKYTNYVKIRKVNSVMPKERKEVSYDGLVWCPNVENGTAVFRKDGSVFISGQTQAPFSNITLDWTVPNDLANLPALVGGKEMDFTYADCKAEMDMINKAFLEIMIEGDANGRGFQYPIPTYSITRNFDWSETENNKLLFEMAARYGTPYFANYVNSDMDPSDIRSMCCRLQLDLRELRKRNGGFFGSGESTGSIGVVTINMPRIAYLSETPEEFYTRLDKLMDIAARSLKVKRDTVTKLLDNGFYPYTKRYLGTFNNHFSTIGLVGMNEVGLNAKWLQADLTHPETQTFVKEVLNHMRNRLSDYQVMYGGDLYNLEATPAESTSYRLAKHDREKYPDIKTAGHEGDTPYYTNSSHLPVDFTVDIFDALDIQDEFQTLYTSGTVFHAFLGEKMPDWKAASSLVRTISENYKLPYFTLSPTYSICRNHGYLAGEQETCPKCGNKTEVYSRITGYYRPIQNWNDGKLQEYKNRTEYSVLERHSACGPDGCRLNDTPKAEIPDTPVAVNFPQGNVLITTATCPNCATAKTLLFEKGFPFDAVIAMENPDLCKAFDVQSAPTLLVNNNGKIDKYTGISQIRQFLGA